MPEKEPKRAAFVAVKAANATKNKTAVHRFRAASFAGVLCAKRTAKNRWTDQKMNAFIFWLAIGFSYARKLSWRRLSLRRKLFVAVFKPVRPPGFQRDFIPLAQVWARAAPSVSLC